MNVEPVNMEQSWPRVTCADVIVEARSWVGTRWGHQGRLKGVRVDCIGVVQGTAKNLRLTAVDFTNYGPLPVPSMMEPLLALYLDPVPPGEERPADIFYMKDVVHGGAPRHVGFMTGATLIHADNVFGECVEHRFTAEYRRAVRRYYRLRGLAD